jgi:hypothetical protein
MDSPDNDLLNEPNERSVHISRLDDPPDSAQPTPDLHIPENRDGFFGYTEEKAFQQVCPAAALILLFHLSG